MRLGNSSVESLALLGGNAELERGGLAAAVAAGEGSCAPGRAAVNLLEVAELREGCLVAEGHVDEAVVRQRRHGCDRGRLLAATLRARADEQAGVLAPEGALDVVSMMW